MTVTSTTEVRSLVNELLQKTFKAFKTAQIVVIKNLSSYPFFKLRVTLKFFRKIFYIFFLLLRVFYAFSVFEKYLKAFFVVFTPFYADLKWVFHNF